MLYKRRHLSSRSARSPRQASFGHMMQVGLPEWLVAMATRDASDHTGAVGALYRRLAEQLAGATSGEATTGERLFFAQRFATASQHCVRAFVNWLFAFALRSNWLFAFDLWSNRCDKAHWSARSAKTWSHVFADEVHRSHADLGAILTIQFHTTQIVSISNPIPNF